MGRLLDLLIEQFAAEIPGRQWFGAGRPKLEHLPSHLWIGHRVTRQRF